MKTSQTLWAMCFKLINPTPKPSALSSGHFETNGKSRQEELNVTSGSSKGQSLGLTRSCLLAYAASCPRGLLRCRRLPVSLPVLFPLPGQDPKWIVTVPASNSRRRRVGMVFRRILSERADWFTPNHAPVLSSLLPLWPPSCA